MTDLLAVARPRPAVVERVADADTIVVELDLQTGSALGADLWAHGLILRLYGCNARALSQPGGPEAAAYVSGLLPAGTRVLVSVVGPDKFGDRRDASVTLPDGRDLVGLLVAEGWAAVWNGHGPKPVPPWPRVVAPPVA